MSPGSDRTAVLFLGDLLDGLRALEQLLRHKRAEWEMSFVGDAEEALERIAAGSFDVVVADDDAPGEAARGLLSRVRERSPRTIRFLLAEKRRRTDVVGSLGRAHQVLAKPCDAPALERAIERALRLRDLLASERLARVTSRIQALPQLPAGFAELQRALDSERSSVETVGLLIGRDPALTAKVLQLVNSSLFGLPRRITSPVEAASYLGLDTIRSLVLASHALQAPWHGRIEPRTLERVWKHSSATAALAKAIVGLEGGDARMADDAFLAGLLHETGELVLEADLRDELAQARSAAERLGQPLHEAERRCLGASHALVGAYLFALWGLSDEVVEAIAFGHEPDACKAPGFSLVTALHAADVIAARADPETARRGKTLDVRHLGRLGLLGSVPRWERAAAALQA